MRPFKIQINTKPPIDACTSIRVPPKVQTNTAPQSIVASPSINNIPNSRHTYIGSDNKIHVETSYNDGLRTNRVI
jgi:hypothetical protein